MRRREFLGTGLSLGAAAGVATGTRLAPAASGASAFDPMDWSSVRDQFPLTRSKIHLATFLLASHPRPVAEAIERHRRALDENPADYWHEQFQTAEAAQLGPASQYMGVSPAHVALTDSTTMGLGLVYASIRLRAGQEILTTTHDHYSTQMAVKHRADRTGAAVRTIPLYDDPARTSVDEIVSRVRASVTDRTRVLAVTWVHSCTGVKLPLAAISDALADINARRDEDDRVLLCVDGVHGFGIEDATMDDLGCDVFIAGTHKWIFAPRGTGLIWGRPEAWEEAAPIIPSFGPNYAVWLGVLSPDQVPVGSLMTPGGFHSFEHRWAVGEAFRFHLAIGKQRVQRRIHRLNTIAKDAMAEMDHVTLHTPRGPDLSAGIICFEVDGMTPPQVVDRLAEHDVVASTSPYRVSYARLAPSLINDEGEIERTMRVLREMA